MEFVYENNNIAQKQLQFIQPNQIQNPQQYQNTETINEKVIFDEIIEKQSDLCIYLQDHLKDLKSDIKKDLYNHYIPKQYSINLNKLNKQFQQKQNYYQSIQQQNIINNNEFMSQNLSIQTNLDSDLNDFQQLNLQNKNSNDSYVCQNQNNAFDIKYIQNNNDTYNNDGFIDQEFDSTNESDNESNNTNNNNNNNYQLYISNLQKQQKQSQQSTFQLHNMQNSFNLWDQMTKSQNFTVMFQQNQQQKCYNNCNFLENFESVGRMVSCLPNDDIKKLTFELDFLENYSLQEQDEDQINFLKKSQIRKDSSFIIKALEQLEISKKLRNYKNNNNMDSLNLNQSQQQYRDIDFGIDLKQIHKYSLEKYVYNSDEQTQQQQKVNQSEFDNSLDFEDLLFEGNPNKIVQKRFKSNKNEKLSIIDKQIQKNKKQNNNQIHVNNNNTKQQYQSNINMKKQTYKQQQYKLHNIFQKQQQQDKEEDIIIQIDIVKIKQFFDNEFLSEILSKFEHFLEKQQQQLQRNYNFKIQWLWYGRRAFAQSHIQTLTSLALRDERQQKQNNQ